MGVMQPVLNAMIATVSIVVGAGITQLNRRTFDHKLTGWTLTGGHTRVPCGNAIVQSGRGPIETVTSEPDQLPWRHGNYHGQGQKLS